MGHLGYKNLLRLNQQAEDVDIKGPPPNEICGECMKGRQQRRPSKTPMTKATGAIHRVHSDLMGPFPTTRRGERYLMIIKDDYSGAQWVYPLRTKNQAFASFKGFKTLLENQIKERIKFFRSDGGGEFNSTEFQLYLRENGIKWEPSAPHTPEQNGKVERNNNTIMSSTRSMLKEKRLPSALWGEVAKTAAYLRNRAPGIGDKTPYQMLNNARPRISRNRIKSISTHPKRETD